MMFAGDKLQFILIAKVQITSLRLLLKYSQI